MPYNVSVFGVAAAIASLDDPKHIEAERARNTEVRAFTVKALEDLGCKPTDSQGNFLFVDIGRPADGVPRRLREAGGHGRAGDFPPFEKTHARISIGTMDEMKKATAVFRNVLRPVTTTAAQVTPRIHGQHGWQEAAMALSRRGFVQTVGIGSAAA